MSTAIAPSPPVPADVPTLLSLNAGYVDTAGFLALHGLFTAHVTGNFVTIGAALALGTYGVVTKLLALPTFCLVVMLARLLSYRLIERHIPVLRTMLALKVVLLTIGAALAIRFGPFESGDTGPALAAGLALVAGMAIQNAVQRVHLSAAPPTTLMTGTTTQIMLDVADLIHGASPTQAGAVGTHIISLTKAVFAFALGCGCAALLYVQISTWCFAIPPVVALLALLRQEAVKR
jgi:uncharacterized membrane protein YoaK (UPF0700 family)